MDTNELIRQARRIIEKGKTSSEAAGILAEALEFLRIQAGEKMLSS